MEKDKEGIIGFKDSRKNTEKMKEVYKEECLKLKREKRQNNKDYFINKWKIRIGNSLVTNVIFGNISPSFGWTASLVTGVASEATIAGMKIKNMFDKRKYKKEMKKLKADFINGKGIFQEYVAYNNTECEKISHDENELTTSYQR